MQQDSPPTQVRYDYTSAGFDNFLTRSIDEGSTSRAGAFDRSAVSGFLGDTLRIGKIQIDGANGRIVVVDASTNRIVLGQLGDGTQGFVISKEGIDVLKES